jgi:hypothetical protein
MKNILNKSLYQSNKDFANKFRDSFGFQQLYKNNLLNTINSMFVITRPLNVVAFMGPNPELFVEKLPPSNNFD